MTKEPKIEVVAAPGTDEEAVAVSIIRALLAYKPKLPTMEVHPCNDTELASTDEQAQTMTGD